VNQYRLSAEAFAAAALTGAPAVPLLDAVRNAAVLEALAKAGRSGKGQPVEGIPD